MLLPPTPPKPVQVDDGELRVGGTDETLDDNLDWLDVFNGCVPPRM